MKVDEWFQSFIDRVNVLEYKLGMNLRMPGGASLYSLSVAWVSIWGPLAPKVWRHIFGFVLCCQANQICALTKRVLLFMCPFLCLKGSMLYKAFLSCISWIHSNNCKHSYIWLSLNKLECSANPILRNKNTCYLTYGNFITEDKIIWKHNVYKKMRQEKKKMLK